MNLITRVEGHHQNFELEKLFIEELGWDRHTAALDVQVDSRRYSLRAIAEKRGVQILQCLPDADGAIPDYNTRRRIEREITQSAYEHLLIFVDGDRTTQIWQWVARRPGQPAAYREHTYQPKRQAGDALIQKLSAITIPLDEEEALDLTGTVHKLRDAFDRDRVTRKFYERFKKEHTVFLQFIQGIQEQGDREWYASLMLNRLMFVYFIQKKGFLDGDTDYLRNRLERVRQRRGKGQFLTFYRYFLCALFHQGFARQPRQRELDAELQGLLGEVPYLNGGLFDLHELEGRYTAIDIPDEAFEQLFAFFDQYDWHLDTRPLRNDREINPDVLGYIFEKYINQKQMGAYYTKEDITEYIGKHTIIPYLLDAARKKCAVAFERNSALWRLLQDDPDRYLYPAVRQGVIDEQGEVMPLPAEIARGVGDVQQRGGWNRPAVAPYALPTETWREHVARRQRCLELREKLRNGEVHASNDLITYNLNIRQFAEDAIVSCEGPELLRAFYQAIAAVTVLDPTCGSGAFLFAVLTILEPLYEACLERMQAFVGDLERSGEAHSPRKFEDFRRILTEMERHPNRTYFILKSIIVNNLYGVDIMEEAVEICKLRLFLKLVAQVDRAGELEPLPDIDFNIRAGNTLVGFVSLEEIRQAAKREVSGQGRLLFGETETAMQRIEEEAEIVERAFRKFHQMQEEYGMDARGFALQKQELRQRLDTLTAQLDGYLAREYGIDPDKRREFEDWNKSHQPFHWFAEFYGIMRRGGFDVIIGNPPYVEYTKVKKDYVIQKYDTEDCGNLYAFIIERNKTLIRKYGKTGMIIPHSAICTDRMEKVQHLLNMATNTTWISTYCIRPAKLFVGVDQRLSIYITMCDAPFGKVFATRYHRWHEDFRPYLLTELKYIDTIAIKFPNSIPKINSILESDLWLKITKFTALRNFFLDSNYHVYFHNAPRYWVRAMDFAPYFWSQRDGEKLSTQIKILSLPTKLQAAVTVAVLNSSLFYWWFLIFSDCRHLNLREIANFPIGIDKMSNYIQYELIELSKKLMTSLKFYAQRKECEYKTTGKVIYDEFYPKYSKHIIDEIDSALAKHYGFTAEELDFIINYDIKYRMGADESGNEE